MPDPADALPAITAGLHDLPIAQYQADPCPAPSLSSSIAKVIVEHSPRHAWLRHPRLNPKWKPEKKRQFDIGTAAHDLLLTGGRGIEVVDGDSYRGKVAQMARDAAHVAGRTPLLAHEYLAAMQMVRAARAQLRKHEDARGAFENGKPEQTLIWQEGGIWCRARLDWLPMGGNVFFDYKTTGASANPDHWGQRQCFDTGCDVQAAFYLRGIRRVLGLTQAHFRFVVQETEPPHALSVVALDPEALALADDKVEDSIGWWRWCLEHDAWPGYPRRTAWVGPPPWHATRAELRRARRDAVEAEGADLRTLMLEWYAPLDGEEGDAAE